MNYTVSVQQVSPRPIAAVAARMPIGDVPARFASFLNQVYTAARSTALTLDGQNVFVYRGDSSNLVDVEFGVGVAAPFAPIDRVAYSQVPGGEVATTRHWGAYSGLGDAHAAVHSWCKAHGRSLSQTRWEVYGHWSDDPAKVWTDVYWLLNRGL